MDECQQKTSDSVEQEPSTTIEIGNIIAEAKQLAAQSMRVSNRLDPTEKHNKIIEAIYQASGRELPIAYRTKEGAAAVHNLRTRGMQDLHRMVNPLETICEEPKNEEEKMEETQRTSEEENEKKLIGDLLEKKASDVTQSAEAVERQTEKNKEESKEKKTRSKEKKSKETKTERRTSTERIEGQNDKILIIEEIKEEEKKENEKKEEEKMKDKKEINKDDEKREDDNKEEAKKEIKEKLDEGKENTEKTDKKKVSEDKKE